MNDFLKLLFYGKKQGTEEAAPVSVHPSGALRVFLEGFRSTVTFAISSLPNLVVSSMPSLTVGSLPVVTTNPTMPTLLYQGLLSGSDAVLYTAAANWRQIEIYLVNVDTVPRTATLYLGNPGADNNTLAKGYPVPTNGCEPLYRPSLATGAKIGGLCDSANKVKIEIYGVAA